MSRQAEAQDIYPRRRSWACASWAARCGPTSACRSTIQALPVSRLAPTVEPEPVDRRMRATWPVTSHSFGRPVYLGFARHAALGPTHALLIRCRSRRLPDETTEEMQTGDAAFRLLKQYHGLEQRPSFTRCRWRLRSLSEVAGRRRRSDVARLRGVRARPSHRSRATGRKPPAATAGLLGKGGLPPMGAPCP